MYLDIPKSCEFGGCKLYLVCTNEKYKKEHHKPDLSPPVDKDNCVKPCEQCVECFTYLDKYNGDKELWADIHGFDE